MSVKLPYAALCLALSRKYAEEKDVAIAVSSSGTINAIAVDDSRSEFDSRSAVINLIQNYKINENEFIVYSNQIDQKSLGMIALATRGFDKTVAPIVFLSKSELRVMVWERQEWKIVTRNNFRTTNGLANRFYKQGNPIIEFADVDEIQKGLKKEEVLEWIRNASHGKESLLSSFLDISKLSNISSYSSWDNMDLPTSQGLEKLIHLNGENIEEELADKLFMTLAWAIVAQGSIARNKNNSRISGGHNIGSVMRDSNYNIISWGLNTNKKKLKGKNNYSLHGEVNLIQIYQKDVGNKGLQFKDASTLYTTLEPCQMCASMFAYSAPYSKKGNGTLKGLSCIYGLKDPAIKSNALSLKQKNNQKKAKSTIIGDQIDKLYENDIERSGSNFVPMTEFLKESVPLSKILESIGNYLNMGKSTEKGKPERIIWENGLKLLYHIDRDIAEKWEAKVKSGNRRRPTFQYYEGVIPKYQK